MTLTLRSPTSFINIKETKGVETPDDFLGMVSYAQAKPYSCRLIAKSSMQESQNSNERIIINPMEGRKKEKREKLHVLKPTQSNSSTKVPVFVMLPLDTMTMGGNLNKPRAMNMSLMALRSTGVEGVMVDAWWGLVEKDGPLKYNWEGYAELVKMCQEHGLKLQVVMSFHQCGGNVGDSCSIPLPPWVLEEISNNPDLVYTDRSGRRNPEYISLGCDQLPVLKGRTPIQVYSDYMKSFRERFKDYLGNVIVEIQVGMGPGGELRYPSYPESNGTWRFPGNGEFQCYDKYMRASLVAAAKAGGKDNWGQGGPHRDGTWNSEYGQFFLEWYSGELLEHGDRILAAADSIYQGTGAKLSGKVAGIHWHYNTRSHAAELTEGYYNTGHRDGYLPIARMLAKNRVALNFTCMDMRDGEQPQSANCSTEGLVRQVKTATRTAEVEVAGENALERYDEGAYSQVLATSRSDSGNGLIAFTFLRMNKRLFEPENWRILVQFVKCMSDGGRNALPECDSSRTDHYVGFIKKNHIKKAKRGSTSVKMDICIPVIYLFHYRAAEKKSSTKHQNCHTQ